MTPNATLPTAVNIVAELAKSDPRWQFTAGQIDAYSRVAAMLDGMRVEGAPYGDLRDIALMLAAEAVTVLATEAVRSAMAVTS